MASYRVRIKASAAKEVEAIQPKKVRLQVVVYSIADDVLTVFVIKVGHRGSVYRIR